MIPAIYEYTLAGLDLRNKTILDAAIGGAESTVCWAQRIREQGGTSRIIAVDNALDEEQSRHIHEALGEYGCYVGLRKADIFDLDFLALGLIDIINCADTIVFLNDPPLRLLAALQEFDRVLKPGGRLFIQSEVPVRLDEGPEYEGQWRRWQLAKAVSCLGGKEWSSEPLPEDVKRVLSLLHFEVEDERVFPAARSPADVVLEWADIMRPEIVRMPWPELREPLQRAADEVRRKVLADGYSMCPALYVLKCRKSDIPG